MPRRPALRDVSSKSLNTRLSGRGDELSTLVADSQDSTLNETACDLASEKTNEVVEETEARRRDYSPSPPPRPAAPARISWRESTPKEEVQSIDYSRPIFDIATSQATQSLHMTFNYPTGHQGPFEVKMDLASLFGLAIPGASSSSHSIQPPYQQYASKTDLAEQKLTARGRIIIQSSGKGFHSLPPELRNRVYSMLFVKEEPVQLHVGYDLSRSSQFLSYQRQVHQEGASILYGLNEFVFSRSAYRVGRWFDPEISESGYTHVEECLRSIGHNNLSLMRHVTFVFTDACKQTTPELSSDERRFVNDKSLHRSLRRLGKYGNLQTLEVNFQGKRMVTRTDKVFLDALTTIMAKKVYIKGNLDPKIRREVRDFLIYPGSAGPFMKVWNKPWEKAFGPRCR